MQQAQAEHDQHAAEEHRKADTARKEKANAIEAQLDNIVPHLDIEWLKTLEGAWPSQISCRRLTGINDTLLKI